MAIFFFWSIQKFLFSAYHLRFGRVFRQIMAKEQAIRNISIVLPTFGTYQIYLRNWIIDYLIACRSSTKVMNSETQILSQKHTHK